MVLNVFNWSTNYQYIAYYVFNVRIDRKLMNDEGIGKYFKEIAPKTIL